MFKKMKWAGLILAGLLLMVTVAACAGSAPPAAEEQTAAPAVTQTAQRNKNRLMMKRAGQTAAPDADAEPEEADETDEADEMWEGPDWFTLAAELLGMDEDALWEALVAGQSIADLAQANGVDAETIVAALTAADAEWINQLLAAGELEQADAAEWLAETEQYAREFVTANDWAIWEGVDWFAIAQETIGVDEETLFEADSIAAAAQANGADPQTVIDAIVAAETEWINGLVAAGELEQAEAAEWLAEVPAEAAAFVNEDWAVWEGVDWFAIAQEALGVDEETLWNALDNGQSIAELAEAQGVDPQTIAQAITAAETEWVNQMTADGELTQAEADEWLAELDSEIQLFLNDKW